MAKVEYIERQTLRIPEVAKILDISRAKAYDLAHKGVFPAIQLGNRDWRVPKKAFEEWLNNIGKAEKE